LPCLPVSARTERLGTEKISRLVYSLALPSIVAQLVNLLYSIVDRIYIGRMPDAGALALTGLGLSTPFVMLMAAFAYFAGNGGSPLAAMALGAGDREEAERILGNAAFLLLGFSVLLTGFGLLYRVPLLYLFGASDATIQYANAYCTVYICGTVFVLFTLGLNPFITCQGRAGIAMYSIMIGAGLNIVLDPLFIFVFHMGITGAAIATVLSQLASAIWVVRFLLSSRSFLRLRLGRMRPNGRIVKRISALGFSPFIMRSTEGLISIVFTSQLKIFGGDLYIGAYTILQSVMLVKSVVIQGFTYGALPTVSYNYGAGKYDRVRAAVRYICFTAIGFTCVYFCVVELFPGFFGRLFTNDEQLLALVRRVLPIYMGGVWIFGVHMSSQSCLVGLGRAKTSAFVSLLRKVILLTPLGLILPRFMGVMGIFWAEMISDTLCSLVAGTLFLATYRRLPRENLPS
jgi:putative MATE family efflux protein